MIYKQGRYGYSLIGIRRRTFAIYVAAISQGSFAWEKRQKMSGKFIRLLSVHAEYS